MSSSACVGCALLPSPALITWPSNASATLRGKPGSGWRMTRTLTPIAASVIAVSSIVSPLLRLDIVGQIVMTSAPRRCSASVNEVIVRVLCSKNMFTHAMPSSVRSGRARSKSRVRAKIYSISSAVRSSRSMRLRRVRNDGNLVRGRGVRTHADHDAFAAAGRDKPAHVVGLHRQLAQAAVHQHAETNRRRAPEIRYSVERGAHGSTGIQHVVDDHDHLAGHVARNLRFGQLVRDGVVAVEIDVQKSEQRAAPADAFDALGQTLRERFAAAANADEIKAVLRVFGLEHLMRQARNDAIDLRVIDEHALGGRYRHVAPPIPSSAARTRASSLRYCSNFSRSFATTSGFAFATNRSLASLASDRSTSACRRTASFL